MPKEARESIVMLADARFNFFVESPNPEKDAYELDVDTTLMRLRFPLMIKQAREVFGDDVCGSQPFCPS